MTESDTLNRGREAFGQQAWAEAYKLLVAADCETGLEPNDLDQLAKTAYLIGKESESINIWTRAHNNFLDQNDFPSAISCAFWLGLILLLQGNLAQGSGWMARAERLVNDYRQDCVEQGLLLVPKALQFMKKGDPKNAYKLFNQALEFGLKYNNQDLMTLSRLGCGQTLIQQKDISEGTILLDEAMVSVISDETSPIVSGLVYCAVIETCQNIYDLSRAQEWTAALSRWCSSHPELVPYRGHCLVRRAEIMQLHGEWPDAINEVQQACKLLSKPPGEAAAGEAFYRQAEICRLQGNFSEAMEMYRQASKWGRKPQPGLALLRLIQGKTDVAKAAIQQLEKEKKDSIARSKMLPAYIEIMLHEGEIIAARSAANELAEVASEFHASYLQAVASQAQGSIFLASGEAHAALEKLHHAQTLFNNIEATYESAKNRVLIGRACEKLGDKDTAEMELEAARETFEKLGAKPDLSNVDSLTQNVSSGYPHGLTPREQEVLLFLTTGKTNKEIAAALFISERTVDRHVSNILAKLNVSSRAAATAYAYEHNLV